MFKYTNTVIVNSDKDSSGEPKWFTGEGFMEVKRVMKFEKPSVVAIYERDYRKPVLGKVTLDLSALAGASEDKMWRLKMYIRLSGSQNSYYSNDYVFKGKPFYVEFEVKAGETASQIASKTAKMAKHYQQMYDNKYMKFSAQGSNLVIDAVDEFQRFTQIEVQEFVPDSNPWKNGGSYVTKYTALVDTDEDYNASYKIEQGAEGFGTYFHVLKDLMLPTIENTKWAGLNSEERPVPGEEYTQFTVHYRKVRGQVGGGGCVGEVVTSETTHVFYVAKAYTNSFRTALQTVGNVKVVDGGSADNNGGFEENTASASSKNVTIPADGTAQEITITTDAASISAKAIQDWITTSVAGNKVTISASANTSSKASKGTVLVVAGDQTLKISVTQLGA